ncbi:MAG: protein translocase subunit SecD [Succinivibrionaceae bacterium]
MNKFPLWKNLLIVFVIIFSTIYAIPNLFGEDPAVQISGKKGVEVTEQVAQQIQQTLKAQSLDFKAAELEKGQLLIRFNNEEVQMKAQNVIAASLGENYSVAINLAPATPKFLTAIGATPLKLGLDLRGGVHFLEEIDMKTALDKSYQQLVQDCRSILREQKIRGASVRLESDTVRVAFQNVDDRSKGLEAFRRTIPGIAFNDTEDGVKFYSDIQFTRERIQELKTMAVEQNITIIRNRVNELGVAEPLVQRQGSDRIVIELPGIQDTARAKEILGATATLEFRLVDKAADLQSAASASNANVEILPSADGRQVALDKHVILTGDHITDANSGFDEYGRPQVNIKLDSAGGSRMSNFTKDHVGALMATVFIEQKATDKKRPDGSTIFETHKTVANMATIQTQLGSSFRITGIDNPTEAHNLALILRSGALIAPIQIVEERTIGPSLGQQNIDSGMKAMAYGLGAVLIFMVIYYNVFGLIADFALVCNLLFLVGCMSIIPGAVMTMPGIAGIVLTLGMAIDANVLIYERIREELRKGSSVQMAINEGYAKAFVTILDSNLTTLATALVLFAVGTGSVKGFALVLMIGIVCSMFTAITVSRGVVNAIFGGRSDLKKLPI